MITARIRPRCQSFMSRLFLHRPSMAADSAHLEDVVSRFGIADVQVVKSRRDSKIIARGTHPEWGPVAVKVIDPIVSPAVAYQGLYADGVVAANPAGILPRIHSHGLGYSISEWVHGSEIRNVEPESFRSMPLTRLADDLAVWSTRSTQVCTLEESAVLSTLRFYIGVTVRRMQYRSAARCVAACARFMAGRRRLGGFLDSMASLAPRLRLQRTLMLSDLHPLNVIYDSGDDRLVYIDNEPLRPGNYIFDAVFFLAFLLSVQAPREATDRLARHLFTEEYMGNAATIAFFREFASYIVSTYMVIDGRDTEAIEASLESIRTAGA
jgi:hypothetical protein